MAKGDFAPMLAERKSAHEFFNELVFPLYASPKLDGFRVLVRDGKAVTRRLLPVANDYIRNMLSDHQLDGFDGEVICGDPTAEDCYNKTQRAMLGNKIAEPEFKYYAFDFHPMAGVDYTQRIANVQMLHLLLRGSELRDRVVFLRPEYVETLAQLEAYEATVLAQGYEGVILRTPFGHYKYGRSTRKSQGMLKLKRFVDIEGTVIGFEELMRNGNEATRDELGHTKRSSAQAGLVGGGTLGVMLVRLDDGEIARLGMFKGLTAEDKQYIWDHKEEFMGRRCKLSHFAVGAVDKIRHGKFTGWRNADDES